MKPNLMTTLKNGSFLTSMKFAAHGAQPFPHRILT